MTLNSYNYDDDYDTTSCLRIHGLEDIRYLINVSKEGVETNRPMGQALASILPFELLPFQVIAHPDQGLVFEKRANRAHYVFPKIFSLQVGKVNSHTSTHIFVSTN